MDSTFLILSLFFPRIMLVIYYAQGWIFPNLVPFWADLAMSVFVPRVLILIYIYQNIGAENGWFVAHVILLILAYAKGGSSITVKGKSE